MVTEKLDLAKEDKAYYTARTAPELIEFGQLPYLAIAGSGAPAGNEFTSKVGALYSLAYGVKNRFKKENKDFVAAKLEGLWWVEPDKPALEVPREEWKWKLLIRLPHFVTSESVAMAKEDVLRKKGLDLVKEIGFEKITEASCVQIMHIGPYATEPETIAKMKRFMEENNLVENGRHHEVYLSDPTKMAPGKMQTILRQPVKKKTDR